MEAHAGQEEASEGEEICLTTECLGLGFWLVVGDDRKILTSNLGIRCQVQSIESPARRSLFSSKMAVTSHA
jgi:hypothetical protein